MRGVGAGVVRQPLQGEVHPLGREQRQGRRFASGEPGGAVGDAIVDARQVRQGEHGRQRPQVFHRQVGGRLLDHERQRHRHVALAHHHRHLVELHQPLDLGEVVVGKDVGPGDGAAIGAGVGDGAPGRASIVHQLVGLDGQAQPRIAGIHGGIAGAFASGKAPEPVAQSVGAPVVERADALHGGAGVGEFFRAGDCGLASRAIGRAAGVNGVCHGAPLTLRLAGRQWCAFKFALPVRTPPPCAIPGA